MANCVQCGRQLPGLTFGKKICQWCVQHEAAQRGEESEDARQIVMPAPWVSRETTLSVTKVLFAANAMVFVVMLANAAANGRAAMDFSLADLQWGANFGPYTLWGQWWRLLTYMFMHGGFFHIAMNMWCLWNLGSLCESLYGRWTYAAVYLVTGVAGGLASIAWHPAVPSVGASGALFGLTGALIASFYLGEFSLSGISIKGTLSSLLFFAGFSLVFGMIPGMNIDNGAHIGGLISGLVLGALIARVAPEQDRPLKRVGIVLFMVLIVGGSAVAIQRWRGPEVHFGSAIDAQKNVDRMIFKLQEQVRKSPQDASEHYALAHEYFSNGQIPEGEGELKRVLELQPQNIKTRMELADTYLGQERYPEAQEQFTKVIAQEPNHVGAHAGLGVALAGMQNHEAAIAEYKTALRLKPQASGVYFRMGLSQAQLKQYDDAIASYLKEREQSGDDAGIEESLADAYQAKGLTQSAQEARSKAAQLKGHD
jgi:membrane associated rhomboid family serine protease/Flp pilus assembly protein TadD